MKTLNQALRTILLIAIFISTATNADAYNLVVDGVYYNIYGNNAVVTYIDYYNNQGTPWGYNYNSKYSGHVSIPKTVTYNGLNYTVTAIGDYAFANCTALRSISIPNTVWQIGIFAFFKCVNLTDINIPNSVTEIGAEAFENCQRLTSITIPNSIATINAYTFQLCTNLSSVYFGNSLTSIGNYAFGGCPLSYVTCLAETPPNIDNTTFSSYTNTTLYVPAASIEAYQTENVWKNFKIITDFKPNFLSVEDATTIHVDTIVIPVTMENENDITAFQTDIYLMNGFELVKDENDEYLVVLSERKGRDHVIMASDAPDGAVRVISYSPTLKTFSGNEGPLFYITIKVPQNGDGIYPIFVKNTRLTTADDDEVLSPDASCNITVLPYILGDVNDSGDITVADVVAAARYILYQNPEPFIFGAADLNGDNKITITDVVKIAHMVLDADYGEPTLQNPRLSCMDGMMDGNTASITLENEQEYTAFQFDLTLPEGMTASDFALAERANALDLNVKDRGNGKIRVIGYTPSMKAITGNEGTLLTFAATGVGNIVVDRIELVTPTGETVNPAGVTITRSPVTTVNELEGAKTVDHVDYYNLAGQRVERPKSGATLVVTTYTDGTRTTTKIIQ